MSSSAPLSKRRSNAVMVPSKRVKVDIFDDDDDEEELSASDMKMYDDEDEDEEGEEETESEEDDDDDSIDAEAGEATEDEPEAPSFTPTLIPATSVAVKVGQILRVLKGLGLDGLHSIDIDGGNIDAADLLVEISVLADDTKSALSQFRTKVQQDKEDGSLKQALMPIDSFRRKPNPTNWDSHDLAIDALWAELVKEVVDLGQGAIEEKHLVKPSGPLDAAIMSLWEYPTYHTLHAEYGHVHDRSNPCLRLHDDRIGPNAWVRTQDRIPIRHHFVKGGVPWADDIPNWELIEEKCVAFNKTLIQRARVIVLVGKENSTNWKRFFDVADRFQLVKFNGLVDGCTVKMPPHVYQNTPSFWLVKDSLGVVKHLVFLVFHSQYMIHTSDYLRGAYNDLIWNAACSFAGVDILTFDAHVHYTGTEFADLSAISNKNRKPRGKDRKPRKTGQGSTGRPRKHKPGRLYPLDHKYAGQELSTKKLSGGGKKDASKPRCLCYYVDPETGEQCKRHYGRPDSVKEHFLSRHKGAVWDLSMVKRRLMTESEMELDEHSATSDRPRAAVKLAGLRENAAAQRARTAGVFETVCMVCNGVFGMNNIKKHVERELARTFGPGKVPYHQSMWYRRTKGSNEPPPEGSWTREDVAS